MKISNTAICKCIAKKSARKVSLLLFLTLLMSLLSGCTNAKTSRYQAYVESLISANYLGNTSEYQKMTGADSDSIEAMYLENVTRLANNLTEFYDLDISSDTELAPRMVDVAKKIYSRARYTVAPARHDNNIYTVDLTIYPIDILNQIHPDVTAYVDQFNQRVAEGEFNNTVKEDYEHTFASGIIDLLDSAADSMTYRTPVTVTVRIIETEDSYYIGNEDFRAIDAAIIATNANAAATATDAVPAATPEDASGTSVQTTTEAPAPATTQP